jgi:predicted membrane channel-forming protein YqfA (hemolysin III family)
MIAGGTTPVFVYGFICKEMVVWKWLWLGQVWICCLSAAIVTMCCAHAPAWLRAVSFVIAGYSCLPGIIHLTNLDWELCHDF